MLLSLSVLLVLASAIGVLVEPGWPTAGADGPGDSELRLMRALLVAPSIVAVPIAVAAVLLIISRRKDVG